LGEEALVDALQGPSKVDFHKENRQDSTEGPAKVMAARERKQIWKN